MTVDLILQKRLLQRMEMAWTTQMIELGILAKAQTPLPPSLDGSLGQVGVTPVLEGLLVA
jgi:hypothetical protein